MPGNPKANFDGLTVRCEVLECDPPRENAGGRLAFSWSAGGPVETASLACRFVPLVEG